MVKNAVRITSIAIIALLAILASLQITISERDFPLNTEKLAALDFSKSRASKQQAITAIQEISTKHNLTVIKKVADRDDFLHGRSLYVFNAVGDPQQGELEWFDPLMHGTLHPISDLGNGALDGQYVFSGSTAGITTLQEWLKSEHVAASWQDGGWLRVFSAALIESGAGLALLTAIVLLLTLVMSWYAARSKSRSLRLLSGTTTGRIQREDLTSLLGLLFLPAVVGTALSCLVIWFRNGSQHVLPFLGSFAPLVMGYMFLAVLFALGISALTWPSVQSLADREPPVKTFRTTSEVIKASALVLAILCLPPMVAAMATSLTSAAEDARWASLKEQVSIRFAPNMSEERFQAVFPHVEALTSEADKSNDLSFSYLFDDRSIPSDSLGDHDGLVFTNSKFLALTGVQTAQEGGIPNGPHLQPLDAKTLTPTMSEFLEQSLPIWVRDTSEVNKVEELSLHSYSGEDKFAALVPAVGGKMTFLSNPLIVVIDEPSSFFNDSFLASTISTANIIFDDGNQLSSLVAANSLDGVVMSIDRVSDVGLYRSQSANQEASVRLISVALILASLVMSAALAARIYAASRSRRHFPLRTSGKSWPHIIGRRLAWEASLALGLAVVGLIAFYQPNDRDFLWILIIPPVYLAITSLMHLLAVRQVFNRLVMRSE